MKQVRLYVLPLLGVLMFVACGNKQPSPGDLQAKLDSIARLETIEQLEMQGIRVGQDISPIQLFFDSLNIQPLPVRYSEDYVTYLPNYTAVPYELVKFMNFEGRTDPKAIALPESAGARLMILALTRATVSTPSGSIRSTMTICLSTSSVSMPPARRNRRRTSWLILRISSFRTL